MPTGNSKSTDGWLGLTPQHLQGSVNWKRFCARQSNSLNPLTTSQITTTSPCLVMNTSRAWIMQRSSKASHCNSCVGRQTRLSCRQHSALPLHPCTQEFSGLDWWFLAEHNKSPESHNVEQLVNYSPVLTPSCGAWKPWKVTQSVRMFTTSFASVCLSAQRKIIMCLNLTIPCIPKDILPALLNKESYCTLIPMGKGNNHSCEYD